MRELLWLSNLQWGLCQSKIIGGTDNLKKKYWIVISPNRSLPKDLMNMMEQSRDTTVNCLTNQCASIIEPANEIEDTESPGGKTSLLAYLLSWQLILQIFQTSSLDKRAKLANFLHRGRHVTDLATCLFCIMPKHTENKAIDTQGLLFSYFFHSIITNVLRSLS